MPILHVDDERGVLVSVMQLELVHTEETSLFLRRYEGFAVHCVLVLEPLQIDLFHRDFVEAGHFRYLFVGKPIGQKIPCEPQQLTGDVVAVRLGGDALHFCMVAAGTAIPPLLKADCTKTRAKAQAPEHGVPASEDVHFLAALRAERDLVSFRLTMQQVDLMA